MYLPLQALAELGMESRGVRYTLSTVGALGEAICLFPEEDGALLKLRGSIIDLVGVPDEIDEGWRLHLTVCRGSSGASARAVTRAMQEALPLSCEARGLLLAQMHGDSEVAVRAL